MELGIKISTTSGGGASNRLCKYTAPSNCICAPSAITETPKTICRVARTCFEAVVKSIYTPPAKITNKPTDTIYLGEI